MEMPFHNLPRAYKVFPLISTPPPPAPLLIGPSTYKQQKRAFHHKPPSPRYNPPLACTEMNLIHNDFVKLNEKPVNAKLILSALL